MIYPCNLECAVQDGSDSIECKLLFHLQIQGLVTLNFLQEKKEADFRYGLVRVRENAESIAFYGGEENEMQLLLQRFKSAFENLTVWIFLSYCSFDSSVFTPIIVQWSVCLYP